MFTETIPSWFSNYTLSPPYPNTHHHHTPILIIFLANVFSSPLVSPLYSCSPLAAPAPPVSSLLLAVVALRKNSRRSPLHSSLRAKGLITSLLHHPTRKCSTIQNCKCR